MTFVFHPPRRLGLALGLGGLGLLLALDLAALAGLRALPLSGASFALICWLLVSLPALAWLAWGTYGLSRARYVFSRNALVVEWGARRILIPAEQVETVCRAEDVEGLFRLPGLPWPGWTVNRGQHSSLGPVEFLAAGKTEQLVLIQHSDGWLAISPEDPAACLEAWEQARAAGPEIELTSESASAGWRGWPLARDRAALILLAAGALGVLFLAGYLLAVFPQLPPQLALHFNAQGQPDRFGTPAQLFILPLLGGLAWLANSLLGAWLHAREAERPAAYLLFGATVFVQALTWAAAVSLLTAGSG